MSTKKVLVTGGCGFIGSHLVDRLLALEYSVIVIDNMALGRKENIQLRHPRVTLVEKSIENCEELSEIVSGCDYVFHMAALADIVPSIEKPTDYFQANVVATQYLVEACKNANLKKFVYAASSSCYGVPDTYPTSEDAPTDPKYPYALTKLLGEQIVLHWSSVYGLPAISLRLFNVYGPRARTNGTYGAMFGVFMAQYLAGEPLTVVGDGNQTRDFTYVSDVVDAFVKAAHSNFDHEVFNVGSGATISVNRIVELLEKECVRIPRRPGEPDCTFANISKISSKLNWTPKITISDGIDLMIENISYWADAPVWNPQSIAKATKYWFEFLEDKG